MGVVGDRDQAINF